MKILVLGAGAIGMVLGGFLGRSKHLVCLLGREENVSAMNNSGLCINGIWGNHHIRNLRGYSDLSELREKENGENGFDIALLTVKAYDTESVLQQFCDLFPDSFPVLSFQSGLGNIDHIAALRGKDNVIAGSVGFSAHTVAPATVMLTASHEETRIGGLKDGIAHSAVKQVADLLSDAGIHTLPTTNIEKVLWNTALFDCALNGLAAVLGVSYGFLGNHQDSRKLISSIVREFFAVLEKEKRKTDWPDPETYLRELFAGLIPARHKQFPFMVREIQNGKRTEIDSLNGAIVNIAHGHGFEVPVNWLVWQLVKGKQKIASGRKDA